MDMGGSGDAAQTCIIWAPGPDGGRTVTNQFDLQVISKNLGPVGPMGLWGSYGPWGPQGPWGPWGPSGSSRRPAAGGHGPCVSVMDSTRDSEGLPKGVRRTPRHSSGTHTQLVRDSFGILRLTQSKTLATRAPVRSACNS